jgi:hypothetical protein
MTLVTALMISLTACYLIYNKKDYRDDWWEIWCINESKNSMLKVLVRSEVFVSNAHKNSHAQFEFWLLYVCMYVCIVCNQVLMSKWVLGCCMQPSSYVQMSFGMLYATKFLCPNEFGVLSPHELLCAREITLVTWQLQH